MKKVSISLLLILPFILIYLISFVGKIYASYEHVPPAAISLYVDNVEQEAGAKLYYDIDEHGRDPIPLDIRFTPTETTNKTFRVENDNPNASEIVVSEDHKTASLLLKDKGVSKYTVISMESTVVRYNFSVVVEFGKLREIEFFDYRNQSQNIDTLNVPLGKERVVSVEFFPSTTRDVFKTLEWEFEYNGSVLSKDDIKHSAAFLPLQINPSETTRQVNFLALRSGTITARAWSVEDPTVTATLTVNVVDKDEESKAYFNHFTEHALVINSKTFSFVKEEGGSEQDKILFNDDTISYEDILLKCTANEKVIDKTKLDELMVCFKDDAKKYDTVEIGLYLKSQPGVQIDKISVQYNPGV